MRLNDNIGVIFHTFEEVEGFKRGKGRFFIFLGGNDEFSFVVSVTTKIDGVSKSLRVPFKKGDFGFPKDCCIIPTMLISVNTNKLINWKIDMKKYKLPKEKIQKIIGVLKNDKVLTADLDLVKSFCKEQGLL